MKTSIEAGGRAQADPGGSIKCKTAQTDDRCRLYADGFHGIWYGHLTVIILSVRESCCMLGVSQLFLHHFDMIPSFFTVRL